MQNCNDVLPILFLCAAECGRRENNGWSSSNSKYKLTIE
jgi:hypothetical protein